jgi:ferritin-like metal-binding protein YciE
MKKETIDKTSDAQPQRTFPSEGGPPPAETKTAFGATTKGSDGPAHMTKANQTTSTGSPRVPVSQDFFDKLGEMHDGEKRLTRALPILRLAAKSEDLKTLLGVHLEETKGHAQSLEELAQSSEKELPAKTCQPIAELVKEGEIEVIKNIFDPAERDAAIIAAGRKVEQFEISAYTPLCSTAEENDWTHEFAVLTSILNQEKLANELLAGLAEGKEPLKQLIEKVSLAHAKAGGSD